MPLRPPSSPPSRAPGLVDHTVEPAKEPAARARATALPPEERRAAIIAATVPLLVERGTEITTRQIACAAGVAEGTIFRVFPDKESLVAAALELAFDPAPAEAEILAIDAHLDLETRCVAAVGVMQRRLASLWRIFEAVGAANVPKGEKSSKSETGFGTVRALAAVIEPDRDQLRVDPEPAARLMHALAFASSHPALAFDDALSPGDIVAVVLHGIRRGRGAEPGKQPGKKGARPC